jgi:UDP-sugar pyrophosphorylase
LDQVTPKGIKDYVERARNLLEDSKNNVNPFDDFKPEVPNGVDLKPNSKELKHYEKEGLKELTKTCFVLIAGGLGERLGYSGIKIDLPVSIIDDDYSYMRYYAEYILACRERALDHLEEGVSAESFHVPLAIMVSNDTESRTQALLDKNNYFGLNKDQVHLIKQENVPALIDNSANIAINKESMKVVTKPHGHGDIHNLLFDSKVAQKWKEQGKEWMVFIQDTNALAMKCIPSILGVSKEKGWEMNSITVPRKPGESMGAICKLVHSTDEAKSLVINVEYNVLDSLLKQKWNEKGDIPNDEGYSHFPGNINTLVFKIPEYVTNLEKTGGIIPEFVNPKYANSDRTIFKAPTRLECMM